jgi:putative endonuclease
MLDFSIKNATKRLGSSFYTNSYTSKRLPVELVFYAEFSDINIAIAKEKQIKNWSKSKKEALINGDIKGLVNLARKVF